MKVPGTGENVKIHLHLVHESGDKINKVSITLDDMQGHVILKFINETGKLFSERQQGLNVKFWVTGSLAANDEKSLQSERKYDQT